MVYDRYASLCLNSAVASKEFHNMQFGIGVSAHIKNWEFIQYAESLGFDRAWVGDSQMIWSDCYAVLALAAHHTSRIQLGTGVSITGTRIAPVTAHSIASIRVIWISPALEIP